LLRSALVGGLKIPGLGGFRVASGIFASEHDDSSSVERSGFSSSPLAARCPFPTRFRPGTKHKKKKRDPRLASSNDYFSPKFERDLPKISQRVGALPESLLQNTSPRKKKTTTQKTQKTQKTPGGVVQRALFVESSSSPKVRFERFFLGVARFLLKRKRQTFEERKISLADSSSSKNKRRRRRKKRRKKKEKNATNTQ